MHSGSVKAINRMNSNMEASSEVGDVVQPAEGVGSVHEGETETKHGE